tara:strand:+ start:2836 stop:3351 length:516 start_codon:yes stop_codon:yes gene_type:complete
MPRNPNTGKRLRDEEGNLVLYEGETPEQAAADDAKIDTEGGEYIDEVLAQLAPEDPGEGPAIEQVIEEQPSETEESTMLPDEGLVLQLFEVVFGSPFDPASPADQQKVQQIEASLEADPAMAEGLKSGDVSMTEFALQLYREMGSPPPEGSPVTEPPIGSPAEPEAGPMYA